MFSHLNVAVLVTQNTNLLHQKDCKTCWSGLLTGTAAAAVVFLLLFVVFVVPFVAVVAFIDVVFVCLLLLLCVCV